MKLWLERQVMAKHTDAEKTGLHQGDGACRPSLEGGVGLCGKHLNGTISLDCGGECEVLVRL